MFFLKNGNSKSFQYKFSKHGKDKVPKNPYSKLLQILLDLLTVIISCHAPSCAHNWACA